MSVRVSPETGKELAPETIGMIEVEVADVFKGRLADAGKDKSEFRDNGFLFGKIDGKGYAVVGRGKDLVISGGFNVYRTSMPCRA